MSFDIKYDKNGEAVKQPEVQAKIEAEASREGRDALSHTEKTEHTERTEQSEPEDTASYNVESEEDEGIEEGESVEEPEVIREKPVTKPTPPQESFKMMREKAERAEKRAQEAELLLQQYATAKKYVQPEPEEDIEFSIDEDSLVEGKDLSKVHKEVIALKKQLLQQQKMTYRDKVESSLKSQYKDWDTVFNDKNLKKLEEKHPAIFHTLNQSNDMYNSGISAYTMIKSLGIAEPEDMFIQEKALAQKNSLKPRNTASISPQTGDSPLSKVNAFATGNVSEELKAQLWKEMNQYRR